MTSFWTTDKIMNLLIGLLLAVGIIFIINYLSDVLLPFFVACFVAFLMQPLVKLNQRWNPFKNRTLPVIASILEVSGVIALLSWIIIPSVINELETMEKLISEIASGKKRLPSEYVQFYDYATRFFRPGEIRQILDMDHIMTIIRDGSSLLTQSVAVLIKALSWFLAIIYLFFVLLDYDEIMNGFKLIIPHKWRAGAEEAIHEMEDYMNLYFRGQGLVALCAAILYSIGFSIVGIPLAIPLGLLVGILYMIPYFQYITLLPVAAVCLLYSLQGDASFFSELGKCLLVYVISQSVCDYILTPHIMGKQIGLNAAVILLSLSVWGSLAGIIGMIIALPVTALMMSYYKRYISYPRKPKLSDQDTSASVKETNISDMPNSK